MDLLTTGHDPSEKGSEAVFSFKLINAPNFSLQIQTSVRTRLRTDSASELEIFELMVTFFQ